MKKYITIAALLAAGSAFANAETTFVASSTDGETVTFKDATSTATVVATLNVSALSPTMLNGASLAKYTLIDLTDSGADDIGLQTNYTSNNNKIVYSGIYGAWNQGGAYSFGMDAGSAGLGSQESSFWENVTKASVVLTYSYSTGTTGVLALEKNVDGAVSYVTYGGTWNTSLKGSGAAFDSVVFDSTMVSSADVYTGVVTADVAKTMAVAAIPEPSAFGLLAGLGALALVGTRRRRR